jgi:hypothetical protein
LDHRRSRLFKASACTAASRFIVNDPCRRRARGGRRYRVSEQTLAAFVRRKPNGRVFAFYRG